MYSSEQSDEMEGAEAGCTAQGQVPDHHGAGGGDRQETLRPRPTSRPHFPAVVEPSLEQTLPPPSPEQVSRVAIREGHGPRPTHLQQSPGLLKRYASSGKGSLAPPSRRWSSSSPHPPRRGGAFSGPPLPGLQSERPPPQPGQAPVERPLEEEELGGLGEAEAALVGLEHLAHVPRRPARPPTAPVSSAAAASP